jgi:hypothetical protein
MIHQFLMFLAPDNAATQGLTQATLRTPPANPSQAIAPGPVAAPLQLKSVKFIATVLGNAVGFAMFIAGCWLCLQLVQTYL